MTSDTFATKRVARDTYLSTLVAVARDGVTDLLRIGLLALRERSLVSHVVAYSSEQGLTAGSAVDAAESALPLSLSPRCSVVDFSESGCTSTSSTPRHTTIESTPTHLQLGLGLVTETLAEVVRHSEFVESVFESESAGS